MDSKRKYTRKEREEIADAARTLARMATRAVRLIENLEQRLGVPFECSEVTSPTMLPHLRLSPDAILTTEGIYTADVTSPNGWDYAADDKRIREAAKDLEGWSKPQPEA